MVEWWGRNMKQEVPAKILQAADGVAGDVPAARPPRERGEDDRPPRIALGEVGEEEMGIEATLKRIKESEVQAHRIYREALERGEDARAKIAQRSFSELAKEVVRMEGFARREAEAARTLIPRVEAEMVLGDLHQGILGALRSMGDAVFREFNLPATPASSEKWQALVDELCSGLQEEVFRP